MDQASTAATDQDAVDARVEELLAQLTLEEKAGQLTQLFYFGNLAATRGRGDHRHRRRPDGLGGGGPRPGRDGLAALRDRPGADQPAAAPRGRRAAGRHPAALRLRRDPRAAHDPAGADRARGLVGPADDRARPGRRGAGGAGGRHPLDLRPDGRHRPRPALGPDHRGRRRGPVPRGRRGRRAGARLPGRGDRRAGARHRRPQALRGLRLRAPAAATTTRSACPTTTSTTSSCRPSAPRSRPAPAT